MKIVRVGLDLPINTLFDYRADDATDGDVGRRALVPLGRRITVGVVLEVASKTDVPLARLKRVVRIIRDEPGLAGPDLLLLAFAAAYYHHPLGAVVMSSLPQRLRRARSSPPAAARVFTLTAGGKRADADSLPARAHVQRRLLAQFKAHGTLDLSALRRVATTAPAALGQLIARGWVEPRPWPVSVPVPSSIAAPLLTGEQEAAAQVIASALGDFHPFLLRGVTGSGKTEVYLHSIKAALGASRQALLLVPEISLTPQLEQAVRARFPSAQTVSLHSGLGQTERYAHWTAAQIGAADILLGTRLAVFAPLPRLGLIIVDEEQDASFKQTDGLRYSARDLAVVRAQQRRVPVVLGSATPALESHYNALVGRYRLLELTRRIHADPPSIRCVDTRGERLTDGLSGKLLEAIGARLARREQCLLFVNRRGYAPVLMCRACDWLSGCPRCSAKLVLHLRDRQLCCHHCGHHSQVPPACPNCGNPDLAPLGQGTQRIEAALAACFPRARIARIDRDSTRRRFAWQQVRDQIQARAVDILVGTQMLAKGHDFPHLNLVGVLNADSSLHSTDFRASERLFGLLMQVAGRAGRGADRGEVLIQTDFPQHPLYAAVMGQDYCAMADTLLAERRAAGFPPFVHQALLRAEAPKLAAALDFLASAAALGHSLPYAATIFDPVPAAMFRRAGVERAQLLVQTQTRRALQRFLSAWCERLSSGRTQRARWSIDVDPLDF